jgi:hypothetical protein
MSTKKNDYKKKWLQKKRTTIKLIEKKIYYKNNDFKLNLITKNKLFFKKFK